MISRKRWCARQRSCSAARPNQLIDELSLFVNPVAIGNGLRIFSVRTPLALVKSVEYGSGVVINTYKQ
jgi:hypothetical protein